MDLEICLEHLLNGQDKEHGQQPSTQDAAR